MDDDETLEVLKSVARSKRPRPETHELRCPTCGGDIELADGRLWCVDNSYHGTEGGPGGFASLLELSLKK